MSFHPGAQFAGSYFPTPQERQSETSRRSTQISRPNSRPGTPNHERDSFDFSIPSMTPRLANFGRKISQMRDDFIDNMEDRPSRRSSVEVRSQSTSTKTQPGSRRTSTVEVPGMGDEPVMCPFCDKPLPPALFAQHGGHASHGSTGASTTRTSGKSTPSRPSMPARPATSAGISLGGGPGGKPLRAVTLDTPPLGTLRSPSTPASPSGTTALLGPLPVKSPETATHAVAEIIKSPEPPATAESLLPSVTAGDAANSSAAASLVSDEDLIRWSHMAGIEAPKDPNRPNSAPPERSTVDASTPSADAEKLTSPAPPPNDRKSSGQSSRFNFFRRNSSKDRVADEDEDSDDQNATPASGYAKIGGLLSDDEDEDDDAGESKSKMTKKDSNDEELKEMSVAAKELTTSGDTDKQVPVVLEPPHPPADTEQLREALKEILAKVNDMSKSHTTLLASQASLLTSLKIARSNLVMAEANTELLEAQVKQAQAKVSAHQRMPSGAAVPRSPSTPLTAPTAIRAVSSSGPLPRATRASDDVPRSSTESLPSTNPDRPRPMSLHMPSSSMESTDGKSAAWGFWNGGKKRLAGRLESLPSPSQMLDSLTPTGEKGGFDFMLGGSGTGSFSSALPEKDKVGDARRTGRSASVDDLPLPPVVTGIGVPPTINGIPTAQITAGGEVSRLRQAYATAQNRMEGMTKELTELKKGKVDMEAELENLSQALFEEANKMVSDERRRRAELEETVKEVKAEREALRQTIKVLGGSKDEVGESSPVETKTEVEMPSEEEEEDEEFEPRDLDKHYAALRKSIQHVADGTEGVANEPILPMPSLTEETAAEPGATPMEHSASDPGGIMTPPNGSAEPHLHHPAGAPDAPGGPGESGDMGEREEGTIPHILPVASNPALEGSVDVPEPIPETAPLSLTSAPPADPNPWASDGITPDGLISPKGLSEDAAPKSQGLQKGHETPPRDQSDVDPERMKSPVDELDELMDRLQREELAEHQ